MIKLFQLDNEPKKLYFNNYDRVDEEVLFQQVFTKLKEGTGIVIGKKQIGPSEDFYKCKIYDLPFELFYDIAYGTSIYAADSEALEKLLEFFGD